MFVNILKRIQCIGLYGLMLCVYVFIYMTTAATAVQRILPSWVRSVCLDCLYNRLPETAITIPLTNKFSLSLLQLTGNFDVLTIVTHVDCSLTLSIDHILCTIRFKLLIWRDDVCDTKIHTKCRRNPLFLIVYLNAILMSERRTSHGEY